MAPTSDRSSATTKSNANANKNGNFKMIINRQLRNTRLCTYFQQTGTCKYGARCGFAHDESDLQKSPDLAKTRMCPKDVCEDVNCPFAHTGEELRSTDFCFKTSLCTWYGAGKCRNGTSCRFAHGEQELRSTPGGEEGKPQQSKNAKADGTEKTAKDLPNKKENNQNITEKQPKTQKSEKVKANKSKAKKVDQPVKFSAPQGGSEAGNFVVPPEKTAQEPMFIQPLQLQSRSTVSQPPGFTTVPQIYGSVSGRDYNLDAGPMPTVDYHGLSQLLSGYHCNNVAPVFDAQQQALLSQLGQLPGLTKPKSASAYAPPGFSGYPSVAPGLVQNTVPSTFWEIDQLAENIKMLGEQVSKLQQSISQNPQAKQFGYVSETTKSGSGGSGSCVGHSSSQGSGSGDGVSPPGSPDERHPDELNAEAARLSFALQRLVAAQGATPYA